MIMRRRPLLRAAAATGGAYMAHKAADRRAADRRAAEQRADAEPADTGLPDQLSQLTRLRDQGILTDEEFSAAKAKVLGI